MIVVDAKVWLAAALALMPLLLAMDCGRFIWTFPAYSPSPLWSADQSKIVFNSGFGTLHGRMHVVDSDGSDLLSFPHKSGEYATGISSDGVIVFTELDTSDDGLFGLATPGYQVHTALLDGSDRRILAKGGQDYHYASWSPSGETIAFSFSMDKLHIMRQDGSAKKKLVDNNILRRHFPTAELVHVSPVFWSPNGGKLAFLGRENRTEADDETVIYTVTVDGLNFTRLSPTSSLPAWSPDGKRVAFVSIKLGADFRRKDDISTIYTINSDGGDLRAIASFPEENPLGYRGEVSWSKDGSQIRLHRSPFVTVNIDGSNLRIMDDCSARAGWSPDGSLIAVFDGTSLMTMTPEGSDIRLLARASSNGWSAAGNVLATHPYILERCKWTEVLQ